MKRKLIFILIIFLFIAAVVGGLFFVARNNAIKKGVPAPTFREFLGLGTTKSPGTTTGPTDTTSSDFTSPGTTSPTGGAKSPVIPTKTSVFTNIGSSPSGSTPPDTIIGDTTGAGDIGTGGGGSGGSGGGSTGGGGTTGGGTLVVAAPQCSDEDTTITFTPEEINRLNVLKNRFYAVAETLYTDSDVATEAANYDNFKAKAEKITELYNYCVNSPVFTSAQKTVVATQPYGTVVPGTNGPINYRVPTPFWHDLTKDNQAFIHQGSNWQGIFHDSDFIFQERAIEHALRLNLW